MMLQINSEWVSTSVLLISVVDSRILYSIPEYSMAGSVGFGSSSLNQKFVVVEIVWCSVGITVETCMLGC